MRLICWSFLFMAVACAKTAAGTTAPNFVFMLSDDQGWNGLSVAMHADIAGSKSDLCQTPNLEKLASQGMRFSSAYAPASVCSPRAPACKPARARLNCDGRRPRPS